MEGDRTFHEDCWTATHPDAAAGDAAVPVVDEVDEVDDEVAEPVVEQRRRQPSSEQHDYEQRIASGGLAALLSPYVSRLPVQRTGAESIPA